MARTSSPPATGGRPILFIYYTVISNISFNRIWNSYITVAFFVILISGISKTAPFLAFQTIFMFNGLSFINGTTITIYHNSLYILTRTIEIAVGNSIYSNIYRTDCFRFFSRNVEKSSCDLRAKIYIHLTAI